MKHETKWLFDRILALTPQIRYVAILSNGALSSYQQDGIVEASTAESDRYEELLVNPTLLTLAQQRGAIDCGGLTHIVVGYGQFQQLVIPLPSGHVSVCFEQGSHPQDWAARITAFCAEEAETPA